ncbi:MAG: inosine/xanthosine triphosphatase [Pseudomonadota bacterium]
MKRYNRRFCKEGRDMRVVVASKNPVKVGAARAAFEALFPDAVIEVVGVSVPSGVAEQPIGDEETRGGAAGRAAAARDAHPGADFWVGLEGGIDTIGAQLLAIAWMHVEGPDGMSSQARSASLPLPPAIAALIDEGLELGEANDRVFSTLNSKQGGGAFGLLTDGRLTREGVYADTLILALMPYTNSLFPHAL